MQIVSKTQKNRFSYKFIGKFSQTSLAKLRRMSLYIVDV